MKTEHFRGPHGEIIRVQHNRTERGERLSACVFVKNDRATYDAVPLPSTTPTFAASGAETPFRFNDLARQAKYCPLQENWNAAPASLEDVWNALQGARGGIEPILRRPPERHIELVKARERLVALHHMLTNYLAKT